MKLINNLIVILFISFNFTSCFSESIKMNKVFTTEAEFESFILESLNKQYGIEFETTAYLGGHEPRYYFKKDYSGFTGNVKPKQSDPRLPHGYYTVCNSSKTFETQAHVYMFENQLRTDVEKILTENNIEYDVIDFRGMDRDINKWSQNSTYGQYKASRDFETWIYIKLPKQATMGLENNRKYYAQIILPIVKKIYSALEPEYNVTLQFYLDEYARDVIIGSAGMEKNVHQVLKNPDITWLDLSKFNNYLDWTEEDIEAEIASIHEDNFITAWKKANGIK